MEKLFFTILGMSGTASLVILVVLLARLALHKAPKAFSYALWAVVLFRLLYPFPIESPFSLAPKVQVQSRGEWSDFPLMVVDMSSREVTITVGDAPVVLPETPDSYTPEAPGAPDLPQPDAAPAAAVGRWTIAGAVWLTGAGLLMGYSLFSLLKLRWKLVGSVPLAGEENVRLADHIPSPFVLGLVRPQIYLPSGLRERERDYILLHERTHIRRFDHVTRALAWLALAIHWFNPLVWLAFYLAGKDMEMSCDEAVLRKMGREIRADYSSSLLRLSVGGRLPAGPLAFGGGSLRSRIKNVLHYKKPALWVIGLALIAVVCAGAALATDPGGMPEQEPSGSDMEDLSAGLTFSLAENEEGTFVRIEGSIDGIELEHTVWFPYSLFNDTSYPLGRLMFEMPLCGGEVVCGLAAYWMDESRSVVRVTAAPRAVISSYSQSGNLVFTVDLRSGTLLELDGYIPKLSANDPELVPTEAEAVRTARIAAKLLEGAEEFYEQQAAPVQPDVQPIDPGPHWDGNGYSYTSGKLGVTVEFPPEWAELTTISDAQRTVGANGYDVTRDCIVLRPVHGWDDLTDDQSNGGQDHIGVIYWRSVGEWGYEASSGALVRLAQSDAMELVCWMPLNTKLNFDPDSIIWNEYETVETGLQNGEFEIRRPDGPLPFDVPMKMQFASGAGGWGTDIILCPDGSFEGNFQDMDMGVSGPGYQSTEYVCLFHGRFGEIRQVTAASWSLTLEELTLDTGHPIGEEWIEVNPANRNYHLRYISSAPYGLSRRDGEGMSVPLEPGAQFMFYTPEASGYRPTDELYGFNSDNEDYDSIMYQFWHWMPSSRRDAWGRNTKLGCYALCNMETGYGFFSLGAWG